MFAVFILEWSSGILSLFSHHKYVKDIIIHDSLT